MDIREDKTLAEALEAVLSTKIPHKVPIHPGLPYLQENQDWLESQEVQKLIESLREDANNKKFDDKMQYLGGFGVRVTISDLGSWLMDRSEIVGTEQAIAELDDYNASESIDVFGLMPLASVHIAETVYMYH